MIISIDGDKNQLPLITGNKRKIYETPLSSIKLNNGRLSVSTKVGSKPRMFTLLSLNTAGDPSQCNEETDLKSQAVSIIN